MMQPRLTALLALTTACAHVAPTDTRDAVNRRSAVSTSVGIPLLVFGGLGAIGAVAGGAILGAEKNSGDVAGPIGVGGAASALFVVIGAVLLANGSSLATVADRAEADNVTPAVALATIEHEAAELAAAREAVREAMLEDGARRREAKARKLAGEPPAETAPITDDTYAPPEAAPMIVPAPTSTLAM